MSAHLQCVLQIIEILCDFKQKRGGARSLSKNPKLGSNFWGKCKNILLPHPEKNLSRTNISRTPQKFSPFCPINGLVNFFKFQISIKRDIFCWCFVKTEQNENKNIRNCPFHGNYNNLCLKTISKM